MGNMSYCRFENTSRDLRDCLDAIQEDGVQSLSEASIYERNGLRDLLEIAKDLVEYEDEINEALENFNNQY